MQMNEKPHTDILDREGSQETVRKHLSKQTALLRDIANYGSNLIVRAYDSGPKTMPEIVVCGVFLKQVVGMVDATEILLSAGSGLPALLTARSAFEASTYLEWVLQDDSNRRATRYVVGNYRTERLWVSRVIPGTRENTDFRKNPETKGIEIYEGRPDIATWAPTRLATINKALSTQDLAPIDQEFTRVRGN